MLSIARVTSGQDAFVLSHFHISGSYSQQTFDFELQSRTSKLAEQRRYMLYMLLAVTSMMLKVSTLCFYPNEGW